MSGLVRWVALIVVSVLGLVGCNGGGNGNNLGPAQEPGDSDGAGNHDRSAVEFGVHPLLSTIFYPPDEDAVRPDGCPGEERLVGEFEVPPAPARAERIADPGLECYIVGLSPLTIEHVETAVAHEDEAGTWTVAVTLNGEGEDLLKNLVADHPIGDLAVVIDGALWWSDSLKLEMREGFVEVGLLKEDDARQLAALISGA